MKKLHLSIPEPCHGDWNGMKLVEKGRFCFSCEKQVFDFTRATDLQIIETYNKSNSICGRFLPSQLDRELFYPKKKKSVWLATVFFGIISLWDTKISAQENPKTEQTTNKNIVVGKIAYQPENQEKEITITGIVSDEASNPIEGVFILAKGTLTGVYTDKQGLFKIKAKKGELLLFSFIGMEETERIVKNSRIINVKLKEGKLTSIAPVMGTTMKRD
ncbi:hypothetical protein EQG63_11055 [Flavobacterium amnicola]|uniref:Carboxypeptidase-like regulatory domain-containing protein n=1 Tax=Flavobacterium amnicola TaxID=2506422 RepID=A0A4Q1K144_9FLAO|nr:carboxypeptidase-like regulatory domain-containing protein [Flavobacterium amnicola]RXR17321.1 hypothetical protein EQG63_11055 [Flavobacterium amnicola]